MKRKILLIVLLLSIFTSGVALSDSLNGLWHDLPIVKLTSQGQPLKASDSPAVILNDHTYVPLSALKSLGVELTWNADQYSVDVKLPQPTPTPTLTQDELNVISESVFEVYCSKDDPTVSGQGTGVVIGNLLITNFHTCGKSQFINTKISDKMVGSTETIFKNESSDLMAIKIDNQKSLKYSTELPKIGEVVYSIGFPKEKFTITQGKVIRLYMDAGRMVIVHDAVTNFGSSGGALIDSKGEVIGITTWKFDDGITSGAVPMQYVQEELNKLK